MQLSLPRSAMAVLTLVALAGCAAPETARLHANAAPPPGPHGFLASAPPADNSFYPLRCHYDGPATLCGRETP